MIKVLVVGAACGWLAGCDLVLSLDRPDAGAGPGSPQLREAYNSSATDTTQVTIPRRTDVQPDDVLLVVIWGDRDANVLVGQTLNFDAIGETFANGCDGDYHAFYFSGRARDATDYAFTFDQNANWSVLVSVYSNVTRVSPVTVIDPDVLDSDFTMPQAQSAGTIAWIGAVASLPWNDTFPGFVKRAVNQTVAVFDATIVEGVVPATTYNASTDPRTFCAAAAEVVLE